MPLLAGQGPEVLVEITGLAPGGDAVGRQRGGDGDGRVTFVALAAPGELVRARLERVRARVAWGELVEVVRPSAVRVTPGCPLFGRCGGCQWQHVDQAEQRRAKGEIVSRALGRPVGDAREVGAGYGYRERARFAIEPGATPSVGFRARRSHDIVDVRHCPLLAEPVDSALPALRAWAAHQRARADTRPDLEATLSVQAGRGGEVAALLASAGTGSPRMARVFPARDGGPLSPLEDVDPGDRSAWPDVSEADGRALLVPPGAFAQVGQAANHALQLAVSEAVGPDPGSLLELHAGSGNFTRMLVERAPAVIATDADRAAVARGRRNVPEARWYEVQDLPDQPFDTVVVDPPRAGLDHTGLARAAAAGRRLVYVSCDPQTLARDAKRLESRGLRLEGAVALDLMPQTHHVEVVAVFGVTAG
jgi:23S rRNA (uracil1939-C5)-methyltransferase